jgi:hypothetical protein
LGGAGVGVDADIAEVVSEAGLEEGLGFRIECLARRAKGFAYDRWNLLRSRRRGDGAMEAGTGAVLFFLLFVVGCGAVAGRAAAAIAFALQA